VKVTRSGLMINISVCVPEEAIGTTSLKYASARATSAGRTTNVNAWTIVTGTPIVEDVSVDWLKAISTSIKTTSVLDAHLVGRRSQTKNYAKY